MIVRLLVIVLIALVVSLFATAAPSAPQTQCACAATATIYNDSPCDMVGHVLTEIPADCTITCHDAEDVCEAIAYVWLADPCWGYRITLQTSAGCSSTGHVHKNVHGWYGEVSMDLTCAKCD